MVGDCGCHAPVVFGHQFGCAAGLGPREGGCVHSATASFDYVIDRRISQLRESEERLRRIRGYMASGNYSVIRSVGV